MTTTTRVRPNGWLVSAALLGLTALAPAVSAQPARPAYEHPEAVAARRRLARGWNTWDSRNVLAWVRLPEAVSFNLAFKQMTWIGHEYLLQALIGRRHEGAEQVRPGAHTLDGRYTSLELQWRSLHVRIESAHLPDGELVVLLTPLATPSTPVRVVVETGLPWNAPGAWRRTARGLEASVPSGRRATLFATGQTLEDPYVATKTSYLTLALDGPLGLSTGRALRLAQIERAVARARQALEAPPGSDDTLHASLLAVESALAWNTVYEPRHRRVIVTVGRLWNEEYGGYCLFGWDNFFLAYLAALFDRDLAVSSFVEHLRSRTDAGFIPNDDRGNETKSWDHSQPPVGALMLRELYKRWPERWLLAASFDDLLAWNRWWMQARLNDGLLSYGSHPAPNPYGQKGVHGPVTAGYESGMDDSPMYADVPFNPTKNTMELQDVGLNSLHIADSRALAEMAAILGRRAEQAELEARARALSEQLERLWDEPTGLYLNRRSDDGTLSRRLSPTLFYPLLAELPDAARAQRMLTEHFYNSAEFHGDVMLPSIARNDPSFPQQRYWKGAVWPPLNFLVYMGLRRAGQRRAATELADKSLALFLAEWRRKGYVSENYSALTGTGDDQRLSSDVFHTWGALMAAPALIERGRLPAPEQPLDSGGRR
jgi:hypothetical protein